MMTETQPSPSRPRDVKSQTQRARRRQEGAVQDAIFTTLQSLLRTLSHTLGNPLAGLSLTLELLAGTALNPSQQRYVERCLRVADRLNAHKETWGRLGGPPGQGPFEAVELAPVIEHVLQTLHLTSTFDLHIDVPHNAQQVCAHEGLLVLALTHLLRNAAEALGQQGTLGVRVRRLESQVCISVWDEGPGLSPAAQDALWIKPLPGKAHGGGLGLFWVAAIVEGVHGGTLSFTPRQPHGAAFHMELHAPAHPAHQGGT
jgi:signal transduction histidine kinase